MSSSLSHQYWKLHCKSTIQHSESQDLCHEAEIHNSCCEWEACFYEYFPRRTWNPSVAFIATNVEQICWPIGWMRLNEPELYCLLWMDYHENLDYIFTREAGCFKLTTMPVNFLFLSTHTHTRTQARTHTHACTRTPHPPAGSCLHENDHIVLFMSPECYFWNCKRVQSRKLYLSQGGSSPINVAMTHFCHHKLWYQWHGRCKRW